MNENMTTIERLEAAREEIKKLSELVEEEIAKCKNMTHPLALAKEGSVINGKYIVLEHFENGETAVITKELLEKKMDYGNSNNFNGSNVDKYLNGEYLAELIKEFGSDQILKHEVDLFSMDGLDDYGKINRKVSLLTIDQYRKYRKVLGKNMSDWWWLSTPHSTPSGVSANCVYYIFSGGNVYYNGCKAHKGLRPFFVLDSDTFVTIEE